MREGWSRALHTLRDRRELGQGGWPPSGSRTTDGTIATWRSRCCTSSSPARSASTGSCARSGSPRAFSIRASFPCWTRGCFRRRRPRVRFRGTRWRTSRENRSALDWSVRRSSRSTSRCASRPRWRVLSTPRISSGSCTATSNRRTCCSRTAACTSWTSGSPGLLDTGGGTHPQRPGVRTPVYMKPGAGDGAPVDARSDQYSLAALLYEMLVGEPPVTGPARRRSSRDGSPTSATDPHGAPVGLRGAESDVLLGLGRPLSDVASFVAALHSPTMRRHLRLRWAPVARHCRPRLGAIAVVAWATGHRSRRRARGDRDRGSTRGMRGYDSRTPAARSSAAVVQRRGGDSTSRGWVGLAETYIRVVGVGSRCRA